MGIEKRAHQRHDLVLPITFWWGGEQHAVRSVNVSAGGMLVEMDDPPPTDEQLDSIIEIAQEDGVRQLKLSGTVVHLFGPGFGFRFDRVTDYEEELGILEAYLALHDD
jgi:hypothetical protein